MTAKARLTLRAAADDFSVSYDLVYKAARSGALPSIRPSREYLVKPSDVEALLVEMSDAKADEAD